MWQYAVIIGAIVQLSGIVFYIKETIKGNTKPNRVSWLMWSIAPLIGTAAALSSSVSWAALPVFISGFGPFLVFLFSFSNKKSYWHLGIFDYFCGFFSLLALIFWLITKDPTMAIVLAIISDGLATIPTLLKSWRHPETESSSSYATGLFNAATAFLAVKYWGFNEIAFPIYLLCADGLLVLFISRKFFLKKKNIQ